ncbi:MAG: hypothetical protein WCG29_01730 [Desulfomonile sp.]|jgi:hypothetical protein|nr:hypothetical protein [Deltaproteobacteria bacterium]
MLIKDKGTFLKGVVLFVTFIIILVLMFSPLFRGENSLEAADKLFNSISKGSTYYIPDLVKQNLAYMGKTFDVTIKLKNDEMGQKATKLLTGAGAQVTSTAAQLKISGDLGQVMAVALKDADSMFHNRETEVSSKYGFKGQEVLYVWWSAFKEVDKDLTRQNKFKEAAFLSTVVKKGVEVGYNFFKIDPQSAISKAGILSFSLVFYVVYTLWWGIAILYLFEGFGLQMKAGAKKEV